jgi:hypothetical protein
MKYFLLNPLGDKFNEDYCFTDKGPRGVMDAHDLQVGTRVADEYPSGLGETTLQLGEDDAGLELPSYIGNTHRLFIVDRPTAEIIQKHRVPEIEVLPFKLLNHKGRVHSEDYVFLNLLGSVDCVDLGRSTLDRRENGSLRKITKFVLSTTKLAAAPEVFRVKEDLNRYVFAETLVEDLRAHKCTNFVFDELEQG